MASSNAYYIYGVFLIYNQYIISLDIVTLLEVFAHIFIYDIAIKHG